MARPKRPAATAWWCRCLLVLVAVGSSCRLTLATGRGALPPADKQQVAAQASSYERDDHDHTNEECRADGAVCSRARHCCSNTCLQHTCWLHPHHRPPCRDFSEPCWDSDDCCGAFVCGQVGYHDHPVCYPRHPGPVDVCPVVSVTPPSASGICDNSTAADVAVAFTVSTDTDAALTVPATITASDGRNCSLQGTTTVPSPSAVEYRCPQLNGTWSPPGSFTLVLTASAGPQGCASSTDSATATVTIFTPTCTPFDYTGGWQNYTVPAGVSSIRVDASGAQGGSYTFAGGNGARMSGTFTVTPGDLLIILVGGAGAIGSGEFGASSAGGGGGSFVVLANSTAPDVISSGPFNGTAVTPLLIAGGGGGASPQYATADGFPGQTEENGTYSSTTAPPGGAIKSTGTGLGGDASDGSGGGGFRGNGQNDNAGIGGKGFLFGGAGGVTGCDNPQGYLVIGGFGAGGGGGCSGPAGGGGGYSGGDGGSSAGGAGSFNAGAAPDNAIGARSGNGIASICLICP